MGSRIRIIAQEIDNDNEKIISQVSIFDKDIIYPESISKLGYNHEEQIEILKKVQESYLLPQSLLMQSHYTNCPKCNKKTRKQGKFVSEFHSIFTDHKIELQRRTCSCGWKSHNSIHHLYGSSVHPELAKMQCSTGAEHSFNETEIILNEKSNHVRPVNNDDRIRKTVKQVGEKLSEIKEDKSWRKSDNKGAEELVVNIDGGHVKTKEQNKRSIEELVLSIHNPNNVVSKDKNHNKITQKTYVGSAKDDQLKTIKAFAINACFKEGVSSNTKVTGLSDGAKNCTETLKSLASTGASIMIILDWFHIGKLFKNTEHLIPKEYLSLFHKGKWHLWHGKVHTSILRLEQLREVVDEKAANKIISIIIYIKNNENNIVNYHARKLKGLVYTSTVAESSVENVINDRQKKDKKMQWTREGGHAILQIRTSKMSGTWDDDWAKIEKEIYKIAA